MIRIYSFVLSRLLGFELRWQGDQVDHSPHFQALKKCKEWMNERMNECMNEWMNKWMNEWMNEYMNEWINECMNKPVEDPPVSLLFGL